MSGVIVDLTEYINRFFSKQHGYCSSVRTIMIITEQCPLHGRSYFGVLVMWMYVANI